MSNIKLMPCPHCGREDCSASAVDHGNTKQERWWGNIFCRGCQMHGPDIGPADTFDAWFEKAVEVWNALPRFPQWTTEKPTQDGAYWYRSKEGEKLLAYIDDEQVTLLDFPGQEHIDFFAGQWAGPIPEPQEAKQ